MSPQWRCLPPPWPVVLPRRASAGDPSRWSSVDTAERTTLSDDGATAEYKVYVLLGTQRFESSILLQRSPADGIWRVIRF